MQRASKTLLIRIAVLVAIFIVAWFWEWQGANLCLFHTLTGLECPGCGMTRAFHAISHGDFAAAINYNIFAPVVYLCFMLILLSDIAYLTMGRRILLRIPEKIKQVSAYNALFLVIAYGILRNIIPMEALI
jgi:hypothetical protein